MSYSDVNHFGTIISGCESVTNGDLSTDDSKYAFSVLKLHAQDAGFVAGQEGFLDHIKKGAKSLKEWLLKLIKAVTGFIDELTGKAKRQREIERELVERARVLSNDLKALREFKERLIKTAETCFNSPTEETKRILAELNDKGYLDSSVFSDINVTNIRIDGGFTAIENLSKLQDQGFGFESHIDVSKEISFLEKAVSELSLEVKREVSKYQDKSVTEAQEKMIRICGYLLTKYTRVLDLWSRALSRFNKMMEE